MATVAEILLERGRQLSESRRRQGQASGQMYANLAQTISSLPSQIQQSQQGAQQRELQGVQVEAAKRQQSDVTAMDTAFTPPQGPSEPGQPPLQLDRETILNRLPGHLRPAVAKQFQEADEAAARVGKLKTDLQDAEADYFGGLAASVKSHNYDPSAAALALQHAKAAGYADADQLLQQVQQQPDSIKGLVDGLIAKSPKFSGLERQSAAQEETGRHNLAQETQAATTAKQTAAERAAAAARLESAATETGRHNRAMEARPVGGGTNLAGDESEAIADAIIAGEQPPTLQGLYRNGAAVRAMLAKKGFNLAQATTDWQATTKHLATLNGAQQTRLLQAVDNTAHSLDVIEDLANQWDGGKFPILNRQQLKLAKAGVLGDQAQQIATQLEAQISDVTSELGNVYMGGNSPTDHALQLAGQNLSADWTKDQLKAALKLARTNLQIRQNSMKNVGPAGTSANNPYGTQAQPEATQAPSGRVYYDADGNPK